MWATPQMSSPSLRVRSGEHVGQVGVAVGGGGRPKSAAALTPRRPAQDPPTAWQRMGSRCKAPPPRQARGMHGPPKPHATRAARLTHRVEGPRFTFSWAVRTLGAMLLADALSGAAGEGRALGGLLHVGTSSLQVNLQEARAGAGR